MSTVLNIISVDIRIVGLEIKALFTDRIVSFQFIELKFRPIPTLRTEMEKGSM